MTMTPLHEAWRQAWAVHGTAWEAECLERGLDPSQATADQVLGYMSVRMWDSDGKQVHTLSDPSMRDQETSEDRPQDLREFVSEVSEIAGLSRQERRVVSAIIDGSPIPDGKRYATVLARRFRTTPAAIRQAWGRAKSKIKENWAA